MADYGNPNATSEAGSSTPTALLPLTAFGGKDVEPGKVCKFRVVQVYDDQAEVEYVPHEEGEGEADYGAPAETAEAPEGEMTGLLE